MKKQASQVRKVNDNLHYVSVTTGESRTRRDSTRRPCLCPVCVTLDVPEYNPEPTVPNQQFLSPTSPARGEAFAGNKSEARGQGSGVLGLLKGPNATGPNALHNAWVDRTLEEEGGRWKEDVEQTRESLQSTRIPGKGYTHVYNEGGQCLTCWTPVLDTKPVPPVRYSGCSTHLKGKQKKSIRLAAALLGDLKGTPVFLTLTFKESKMCHTRAKRDLDTFLKRYKRHTGDSRFLWVAEIQTKRAKRTGDEVIHFHLVLNSRVNMTWLQDGWRAITGQQTGQQDIRPIENEGGIGRYITKYISKGCKGEIFAARYGMDRETRRGIKAVTLDVYPSSYLEWHDKMTEIGCQIGSNVVYLGHENCQRS